MLATVGADGRPHARVLVLRDVDAATRTLSLHSDVRSGKMVDLSHCASVAVTFYDPREQLQLRAEGVATVLGACAAADSAWARVPEPARRNYRTLAPPGSVSADESPAMAADGRGNFALIHIALGRLEFLWLGPDRHRRGAFDWNGDGWLRSWLVP